MERPKNDTAISTRVPAELAEQLEQEALIQDLPIGTIFRHALRAYVKARRLYRGADGVYPTKDPYEDLIRAEAH